MNKVLHKIAHLFNWNYGKPYSYYKNGKIMMSFKCSRCGKLSGIHCIDNIIERELTN